MTSRNTRKIKSKKIFKPKLNDEEIKSKKIFKPKLNDEEIDNIIDTIMDIITEKVEKVPERSELVLGPMWT
jgi:hypothetical protein